MVYLSGAGLPRFSWKKGRKKDVVIVVVVVVVVPCHKNQEGSLTTQTSCTNQLSLTGSPRKWPLDWYAMYVCAFLF